MKNKGLTLIELMLVCALAVVVLGAAARYMLVGINAQRDSTRVTALQGNLRKVNELTKNAIQSNAFAAVLDAGANDVTLALALPSQQLTVLDAPNFESNHHVQVIYGGSDAPQLSNGDYLLMFNNTASAVLLPVDKLTLLSSSESRWEVRHSGCPSTIPYTEGTRAYKVVTLRLALGSTLNAEDSALGLINDALYQVMNGRHDPLAFGITGFALEYAYTASNGATVVNPTTTNGYTANYPQNYVEKGRVGYRLSGINITSTAKAGSGATEVSRSFSGTIALLGGNALQIDRLAPCGVANPTVVQNGRLQLTVEGLPSGVAARIGLGNQNLSAGGTLELAVGRYSLTAQSVGDGTAEYEVVSVRPASVNITAYRTTTATVRYQVVTGGLALNVDNPAASDPIVIAKNLQPNITVSGVGGFSEIASTSKDFGQVQPGNYEAVGASAEWAEGSAFARLLPLDRAGNPSNLGNAEGRVFSGQNTTLTIRYQLQAQNPRSSGPPTGNDELRNQTCPAGSTYNSSTGYCVTSSGGIVGVTPGADPTCGSDEFWNGRTCQKRDNPIVTTCPPPKVKNAMGECTDPTPGSGSGVGGGTNGGSNGGSGTTNPPTGPSTEEE